MPIFPIKKKNRDTLRKQVFFGTGIFRRVYLFLRLIIIFERTKQRIYSKCVTLSIKLHFLPFYLQISGVYRIEIDNIY